MRELNALAFVATPAKSVSFEDSIENFTSESAGVERRRRSKGGAPKPWQIAAYTPLSKMILRDAKDIYRNQIFSENAFPSGDARARNGRAAWDTAVGRNQEAFNHGKCLILTTLMANHGSLASTKVFNNWILRMVCLSHYSLITPSDPHGS
jgi:hypothetical protein